jgi:hypothetical protein
LALLEGEGVLVDEKVPVPLKDEEVSVPLDDDAVAVVLKDKEAEEDGSVLLEGEEIIEPLVEDDVSVLLEEADDKEVPVLLGDVVPLLLDNVLDEDEIPVVPVLLNDDSISVLLVELLVPLLLSDDELVSVVLSDRELISDVLEEEAVCVLLVDGSISVLLEETVMPTLEEIVLPEELALLPDEMIVPVLLTEELLAPVLPDEVLENELPLLPFVLDTVELEELDVVLGSKEQGGPVVRVLVNVAVTNCVEVCIFLA